MMRCALELRRWDVRRLCFVNERMRYICYYASFFGGRKEVRELADGLHGKALSRVLDSVDTAKKILEASYLNGYTKDYAEYSALSKTISVYGRICENAWCMVRMVDIINKVIR